MANSAGKVVVHVRIASFSNDTRYGDLLMRPLDRQQCDFEIRVHRSLRIYHQLQHRRRLKWEYEDQAYRGIHRHKHFRPGLCPVYVAKS